MPSTVTQLKGSARLLYGGVKKTNDGFEIKLRDRDHAMEQVAHHLSMFSGKLIVKGDPENPLTLSFRQVQGTAFQPVANPPLTTKTTRTRDGWSRWPTPMRSGPCLALPGARRSGPSRRGATNHCRCSSPPTSARPGWCARSVSRSTDLTQEIAVSMASAGGPPVLASVYA